MSPPAQNMRPAPVNTTQRGIGITAQGCGDKATRCRQINRVPRFRAVEGNAGDGTLPLKQNRLHDYECLAFQSRLIFLASDHLWTSVGPS